MKLNFIFNNSSITRFSYHYRLNKTDTLNDISSYYYKNLSYIDNFKLPANTEFYTEPYYDSINDKGGSIYMNASKDYRVLSFLNVSIPKNCDKFIVKFSPYFIFQPILIKNTLEENNIVKTYMVLTVSIYVNNLLFVELGFKSDYSIYVNNNSKLNIDDPKNKIDLSNTELKTLKTGLVYDSFYIILDKDKTDIRLYDPYYYIYDNNTGSNIPKVNSQYSYKKDNTVTYIPRDIDILNSSYKKCLYNNALDTKEVQFANIIFKSNYINNEIINSLYNKVKVKKQLEVKRQYFEAYVESRFKERFKYLTYFQNNIQNKLLGIINTKFTNLINSSSSLYGESSNRRIFNLLCEKCKHNLNTILSIKIKDWFNNTEISKILENENNVKTFFIENNYSTEVLTRIMSKKDVVNTLKQPTILTFTDIDTSDPQNLEKNPLTQIETTSLIKYKKLLVICLINEIYDIIEQSLTEFKSERNLLAIPQDIILQIKNNTIGILNKIDENTETNIFQLTGNNTIHDFIINLVINEINELANLVILDMPDKEKENLLNRLNLQIDKDYTFPFSQYEYIVQIDELELLCFVPFNKNKNDSIYNYSYTIDSIFRQDIPNRIKFQDVMNNYSLEKRNVNVKDKFEIFDNSK